MKNRIDPKWFNSPKPAKKFGKGQVEITLGVSTRRPLTKRELDLVVKAARWAAGEALRAILEGHVGTDPLDDPKGGSK